MRFSYHLQFEEKDKTHAITQGYFCALLASDTLTRMGLNRNERIAELEKKKQQIANRIVRLRNMESAKQRKFDTRRKILAGAWVLHRAEQDTDGRLRLMLMQGLDDFLEHPRDRELFDLPPKPQPTKEVSE